MLKSTLEGRGALVHYVEIYHRTKPLYSTTPLLDAWKFGKIHCVIITSNEILRNIHERFKQQPRLHSTPLLVVSERAARLAEQLGFTGPVIVAPGPDNRNIVATLSNYFTS